MSVYVDALVKYFNAWGPFKAGSCHMVATTHDELHQFAKRLGLKPAWFQPHRVFSHYDLTASKRIEAVRLGAIEVDCRQLLRMAKDGEIPR